MTLASSWYMSPEIFAAEQERIFTRDWVCVGREEQIARTGNFFTVEIGGESLIVTRDAAGKVHAFFNVCRHRGTRIANSTPDIFKARSSVRITRGRTDSTVSLRSRATWPKLPGFDRAAYPLKEAAVGLWEGFIFIRLPSRRRLFDEAYAPLVGRFEAGTSAGSAPPAHSLRSCLQLEARRAQLLGMLPLPARPSAVGQALALRQRAQRPQRRALSRRVLRTAPPRHEPHDQRTNDAFAGARRHR